MKKLVFALLGCLAFVTPVTAATVQPRYLNISLSNDDPATVMQSYIFSRFTTSEIYSFILLRSETWFPNAVIPGESSAAIHFWFGTLGQTKVNAGQYQLTGTLSTPAPNAYANLTFLPNGTWTCTGDCSLYTYWVPNGTYYDSGSTILSGTYRAFELPLPGGFMLGMTTIVLLLLLAMRGHVGTTNWRSAGHSLIP